MTSAQIDLPPLTLIYCMLWRVALPHRYNTCVANNAIYIRGKTNEYQLWKRRAILT